MKKYLNYERFHEAYAAFRAAIITFVIFCVLFATIRSYCHTLDIDFRSPEMERMCDHADERNERNEREAAFDKFDRGGNCSDKEMERAADHISRDMQ